VYFAAIKALFGAGSQPLDIFRKFIKKSVRFQIVSGLCEAIHIGFLPNIII